MLDVSRKVNNPNFWYGWLEELAAMSPVPMWDPRRFGAKYPYFVDEHYPNAIPRADVGGMLGPDPLWKNPKVRKLSDKAAARIIPPYEFSISESEEGLVFEYKNELKTLLKLEMKREELKVSLSGQQYTRPLPNARQPFVVEDQKGVEAISNDYKSWNKTNDGLIKNTAISPQRQTFVSVCEKFFKDAGLELNPTQQELLLTGLVNPTYDAYLIYLKK